MTKKDDQLDSWKEIAAYLKRGVRTVQRWEREAGLPVRRLATERRGAVYAYRTEIDAWREQRSSLLAADREETTASDDIKRRFPSKRVIFTFVVLLIVAVPVLVLWPKPWRIAGARRLTFEGNILTPAISPDGRSIVFASPRENADGNLDLWLRSPRDGVYARLTATKWHEFDPVFSPDSQRILYTIAEGKPPATVELSGPLPASTTSVYESDLSGHSRLLATNANSARYSPDGHWIACLRSARDTSRPGASLDLGLLPAGDGDFSAIPLGLSAHDQLLQASAPLWSPDGAHILLNARTVEAPEVGWWLVSVASRKAVRIDIGAEMAAIGATGAPPGANLAPQAWLPDGTVLAKGFGSGAIAIWAADLDVRTNRLHGKLAKLPAPVTELRWFSVSHDSILFSGGEQIASLEVISLDRDGVKPLGPPRAIREGNPGGYGYLSLSRDGNILAFASRQSSGGPPDVFALNFETGKESRITGPPGPKMYTAISPDGRRVAYGVVRFGSARPIYVADLTTGTSSLLCEDCGGRPSAWTSDANGLILTRPTFRPQRIALLPLGAPTPVDILKSTSYSLISPEASPDGHWLAFATKEGAAFVAPFRGPEPIPEAEWIPIGSPHQKILNVVWSGDGSRLYWASADNHPGAAINTQFFGARGTSDRVEELYRVNWSSAWKASELTRIAAGGSRILLPVSIVQSDVWIAQLAKRR